MEVRGSASLAACCGALAGEAGSSILKIVTYFSSGTAAVDLQEPRTCRQLTVGLSPPRHTELLHQVAKLKAHPLSLLVLLWIYREKQINLCLEKLR